MKTHWVSVCHRKLPTCEIPLDCKASNLGPSLAAKRQALIEHRKQLIVHTPFSESQAFVLCTESTAKKDEAGYHTLRDPKVSRALVCVSTNIGTVFHGKGLCTSFLRRHPRWPLPRTADRPWRKPRMLFPAARTRTDA